MNVPKLTMRRPDDFHVHLRDGWTLKQVLPATAEVFARALVMPNTTPPILNASDAIRYRSEILGECGKGGFTPLMTIQITDATVPETVRTASQAGVVAGKLYPVGVTTNSENGATDIKALYQVFGEMERAGMVLCLHGEEPGEFCLERESYFLDALEGLAGSFPRLRIVLEHLSSEEAVETVLALPETVAATITAHHLVLTLDDVIGGKLQPHHFCKPLPKTPADRAALIEAAISGNPKFFFGSDSAPHRIPTKECADGAAGVFSAPTALPVLAGVFEHEDALDRFEAFVSGHGARFYGLSPNEGAITLERRPWKGRLRYCGEYVPFMAGKPIDWRVAG
jgi:dihydroorotase